MESFYSIFGLSRDATPVEITKAYRRAAPAVHPDRDSALAATEKFRRLTDAYAVLSDPAKRAKYDESPSTFADYEFHNFPAEDKDALRTASAHPHIL